MPKSNHRFTSDFLRALDWRGFIHQQTDAATLDARAATGGISGYIGFDCTAPSLHVGNLVGIMMLRRLQQAGGRPIVLLGGGTTKIGDPSGRDETRPVMTAERLAENKAGIRECFARFLTFGDGPTDAIMLDNDDWLSQLNLVDFLREVGPHFSVNRMLTMDSVRLRLEREQSLSFLEFNYMVFQAYDFVELARRQGCCLQMGGSDQWGNIVNGVELGRRMGGLELFGLTAPLLTTASGAKMGKTAAGAVWLRAEMRSAYDYWQFWRNAEDGDVGRFLRIFTDLPEDEIARLETLGGAEINDAKAVLATEATALAHGREAADAAAETARATFEDGGAAIGLPEITVAGGTGLLTAIVTAGLAASNSEARRAVQGGSVRLDDMPISDERFVLPNAVTGQFKLSVGKKRHAIVRVSV